MELEIDLVKEGKVLKEGKPRVKGIYLIVAKENMFGAVDNARKIYPSRPKPKGQYPGGTQIWFCKGGEGIAVYRQNSVIF